MISKRLQPTNYRLDSKRSLSTSHTITRSLVIDGVEPKSNRSSATSRKKFPILFFSCFFLSLSLSLAFPEGSHGGCVHEITPSFLVPQLDFRSGATRATHPVACFEMHLSEKFS
ncbi:hypothetical protein AVEN_147441-1 [Araneus ventricosus]|uniref:Uncharacterized protein n=1 Tax=Araneus ventricosus TaxID=182803 RepID=A0A4Y2NUP4_ARAVE|nr:hypothetical protein AVEN_273139-1 [Araneus ventricosus]GBN42853.1 hypothetical protein AVEN_147441-1 [Araneus ventricosus]